MTPCRPRVVFLCALTLAISTPQLSGQTKDQPPKDPKSEKKPDKPKKPEAWERMDYGPFLCLALNAQFPSDNNTAKAIAIHLTPDGKTNMAFDTDTCRWAAAWTGGFHDGKGVTFKGDHGRNPAIASTQKWGTKRTTPGWASPSGSFKDPRENAQGPLPKDWVDYKGIYIHGETVLLKYTVGKTEILELPGVIRGSGEDVTFVRDIQIAPGDKPLVMTVAEYDKASGTSINGLATLSTEKDSTIATVPSAPHGVTLAIVGNSIRLNIPPRTQTTRVRLIVWGGPKEDAKKAEPLSAEKVKQVDLSTYTRGGPPRFTQTVTTPVNLAPNTTNAAYVVDTYTVPFDNPYNSIMRIGGFDFLDAKTAAVSTWSGDVWLVSDISGSPEKVTWKRIASGLFEPLGLKVRDGQIFVHCRDGLYRLHDLNGDQEIDFYEAFNHDVHNNPFFHEFAFDLQTDKDGNFYFAKAGPVNPGGSGFQRPLSKHNGTIMRVSRDGSKLDVIATGFRAPNGIGVNPETGQVTAGDNEGTWLRAPLSWITPGYFGGVVDTAHRPMKSNKKTPDETEKPKPLCWFPKNVDNSNGGQTWVTSDNWGPFKGSLVHTSYGTCSLYHVMYEFVDGQIQGGVTKIPVKFESGICRPRFSPFDGHLYISGLNGWQSSAARNACFQRVRYTGKLVRMAKDLHITHDGVAITFTDSLDEKSATDTANWAAEHWNYEWAEHYGSPNVSVSDPKNKGNDNVKDPVEVKSATLSPDGKTVTLTLDPHVPVMQMHIKYRTKSADGAEINSEIYNTIHKIP